MLKIIFLIYYLITLPPIGYVIGQADDPKEPGPGNAENITVKRYVIEHEYMPPIFGSYKYNPILQQFDIPGRETTASTNNAGKYNWHEIITTKKITTSEVTTTKHPDKSKG